MNYPYYGNPYMPQDNMMRQQPANNGIVWVQGEVGARSYLVAAGCTVPLWDSERQTIYIKSVDNSGIPSMRIFDYTERTQAAKELGYVTREEFDKLAQAVSELRKPARKKEDKTDEPTV